MHKRVSHVSINNVALIQESYLSKVSIKDRGKNNIIVGALSMHDIAKALETKRGSSLEEITKGLPPEIRQFASLFADDNPMLQNTLPPHRPGLDTRMRMQKNDKS